MECPYCFNGGSKVTNKRTAPLGVRRRRECLKCGKRFTTYEKTEQEDLFVVKKDGRRERFERKKLEKGIQVAFQKRPISQEDINTMINSVEEKIRKRGEKEVTSHFIGEVIMKKLKKLDKIAYIRFASVYKNFEAIEDFEKEIEVLTK